MKKKFIFIVGFLLCNFCFGSIVIQNEVLFGVKSTHYENCFDISDSEKNTIDFTFGALTNCMWEFGTKNTEIPFHFMTGVCVGMMENSFSFGVPIVFEFSVAKFDKLTMELVFNNNPGIFTMLGGYCNFYYFGSLDLVLSRKDRKWFFGGAGIGFVTSGYSYTYEGYGKQENIFGALGLHVVVGLRFP